MILDSGLGNESCSTYSGALFVGVLGFISVGGSGSSDLIRAEVLGLWDFCFGESEASSFPMLRLRFELEVGIV